MFNVTLTASGLPLKEFSYGIDAEALESHIRHALRKFDVSASFVSASDFGEDIVTLSLFCNDVSEVNEILSSDPYISNYQIEIVNRII